MHDDTDLVIILDGGSVSYFLLLEEGFSSLFSSLLIKEGSASVEEEVVNLIVSIVSGDVGCMWASLGGFDFLTELDFFLLDEPPPPLDSLLSSLKSSLNSSLKQT